MVKIKNTLSEYDQYRVFCNSTFEMLEFDRFPSLLVMFSGSIVSIFENIKDPKVMISN